MRLQVVVFTVQGKLGVLQEEEKKTVYLIFHKWQICIINSSHYTQVDNAQIWRQKIEINCLCCWPKHPVKLQTVQKSKTFPQNDNNHVFLMGLENTTKQ